MLTDSFDFELPPELIAQQPITPRDAARMLEITPTGLSDRKVTELPSRLRKGDLLIFNNTRVIPTRLRGRRGTVKIEITLHKMTAPDHWLAFAKPGRRLKPGDRIDFNDGFSARLLEKRDGGEVYIELQSTHGSTLDAINAQGEMPLPPYIRRPEGSLSGDSQDYQTIYATAVGAVAAPTAGLHFTPALLAALTAHGIDHAFVTLHVGAGTFLPVKTERIEDHDMHSEFAILSPDTAERINRVRRNGGRIIAVGSTSLRTLETAANDVGETSPFEGETDIFISPGYRFKAVDLFLTNFHLPRSTLFILVSAFSGTENMKAAYRHAVAQQYRFYSYGDCCLLHPNEAA